jgi:hypothetical protein
LTGQIQQSIDSDVDVILKRDNNHQVSRLHKIQVRPKTTLLTQRSINTISKEKQEKMQAIMNKVRSKMLDYQSK